MDWTVYWQHDEIMEWLLGDLDMTDFMEIVCEFDFIEDLNSMSSF